MKLRVVFLMVVLTSWSLSPAIGQQVSPVDQLRQWLTSNQRPAIDKQAWATQMLTREQANQAGDLLWTDYVEQIKRDRMQEWDDKVIKMEDLEMKFEFKTFGKPDKNGRRLFISMHGGGGAPARVNEKQWRNQIGLYEPEEGIYLAPRAPTDTWNLWHQSHIDKFFERIIQDAVVFEGVDPNRVYIMGYSAGGDGVYQLAPRMADHLAAAAMMAGHPNDAVPLGLRNIGFTLHMGGEDKAYNRNKVAVEWKTKLAELHRTDPQGYRHEVVIHKGKGHWMDREDAVAVEWMSEFERDPLPKQIVWHVKDGNQKHFYWLGTQKPEAGKEFVVSRNGQTISIREDRQSRVVLRFNDQMLNLDEPVIVRLEDGGDVIEQNLKRSIATLNTTLQERGDKNFMFSAEWAIPYVD